MLMKQFGIEVHPLNQERAMQAYFSGRATALLDVDQRHFLANRSLSEFTDGYGVPPMHRIRQSAAGTVEMVKTLVIFANVSRRANFPLGGGDRRPNFGCRLTDRFLEIAFFA